MHPQKVDSLLIIKVCFLKSKRQVSFHCKTRPQCASFEIIQFVERWLKIVKLCLYSQAQIFFDYYQGKVIAVSGTKGKSTTATLIYETVKHAGKKIQLIGNIGKPVLDYLDITTLGSQKDEYVVFEVSSYMLEGLKKSNYISILVNIYSDHIDRHQGFENYKNAKLNILKGSSNNILRDEILEKHILTQQDMEIFHGRIF